MRQQAKRFAVGIACAILVAGVLADPVSASGKPAKRIKIASLRPHVQRQLRSAGVAGPTLEFVQTAVSGIDLYRTPSASHGVCIIPIRPRGIGGADCDPNLFSTSLPMYATGLGAVPIRSDGTFDNSSAYLDLVYGVVNSSIAAVRLVGPGGSKFLPLRKGSGGLAVFGSDSPPGDATSVEALNGAGKVVQTIRLA